MLSIFPIQFLSLFAHFILRIFVSSILLYLGYSHAVQSAYLQKKFLQAHFPFNILSVRLLVLIEITLAIVIGIGAHTQAATLFTAFFAAAMILFQRQHDCSALPSQIFWILLLAVSISLTITGAGVFAFDLPI